MLEWTKDPVYDYFHWHHLTLLKQLLTRDWWILQGGQDMQAMNKWMEAMEVLELDQKACRDMLLLAQQGLVG